MFVLRSQQQVGTTSNRIPADYNCGSILLVWFVVGVGSWFNLLTDARDAPTKQRALSTGLEFRVLLYTHIRAGW